MLSVNKYSNVINKSFILIFNLIRVTKTTVYVSRMKRKKNKQTIHNHTHTMAKQCRKQKAAVFFFSSLYNTVYINVQSCV
jgi:hypothetical protein